MDITVRIADSLYERWHANLAELFAGGLSPADCTIIDVSDEPEPPHPSGCICLDCGSKRGESHG